VQPYLAQIKRSCPIHSVVSSHHRAVSFHHHAAPPRGTVFTTIDGLELVSTPSQRGWFNGHRGVWMEHGSDNIMKKWVGSGTRRIREMGAAGFSLWQTLLSVCGGSRLRKEERRC
jgi:hypothetical protein